MWFYEGQKCLSIKVYFLVHFVYLLILLFYYDGLVIMDELEKWLLTWHFNRLSVKAKGKRDYIKFQDSQQLNKTNFILSLELYPSYKKQKIFWKKFVDFVERLFSPSSKKGKIVELLDYVCENLLFVLSLVPLLLESLLLMRQNQPSYLPKTFFCYFNNNTAIYRTNFLKSNFPSCSNTYLCKKKTSIMLILWNEKC